MTPQHNVASATVRARCRSSTCSPSDVAICLQVASNAPAYLAQETRQEASSVHLDGADGIGCNCFTDNHMTPLAPFADKRLHDATESVHPAEGRRLRAARRFPPPRHSLREGSPLGTGLSRIDDLRPAGQSPSSLVREWPSSTGSDSPIGHATGTFPLPCATHRLGGRFMVGCQLLFS
jgi:hypothetical protein